MYNFFVRLIFTNPRNKLVIGKKTNNVDRNRIKTKKNPNTHFNHLVHHTFSVP